MDAEAVAFFDLQLDLFIWPDTQMDLDRLHNIDNYTAETYKEAISSYMQWKENILPQLDTDEKEAQHLLLAQLVLNVLFKHAPNHHILCALK